MSALIGPLLLVAIVVGALVVAVTAIGSAMRKSPPTSPRSAARPSRSAVDPSTLLDELRVTVSYGVGGGKSIEGRPATSEQCWVPAGQEVTIHGQRIPLGMLYVGANLPRASNAYCVEPALIDPSCPVDWKQLDPDGAGMDYWPAYDRIPPSSRGSYLLWLAGGRQDPNIGIGYVFLFFYGLERRALLDAEDGGAGCRDLPRIVDEVKRLLSIYGGNASFHGYATRFLDLLSLRKGPPHWSRTATPRDVRDRELPLSLRIAVGQMAEEGTPLPADWALAWVESDPETSRRTAAKRCPAELQTLFLRRYAQRFNDGIRLKPCKRTIRTEYHAASASFSDSLSAKSTLPDVTALVGPRRKLQQLLEDCTDALNPLSRWLGRNPDGRDDLAVAALLPPDLLDTHAPQAFDDLRQSVMQTIAGEHCAVFDAAQLLGPWLPADGRIPKKGMIESARLLGNAGFGMEPDVRFCGQRIARGDKVVVFRLSGDEPDTVSSNYAAAALVLHLAVVVSGADGQVSEHEEQRLRQHLSDALDLDESERHRLRAHLYWLLSTSPGLTRLKKRLEVLHPSQRERIGDFLVTVAWADGRIDPGEVRTLSKIFRLLGLDPARVHDRIHATPSRPLPADGPVTVVRGEARASGFAIPPDRTRTDATELDTARLRQTLAETAEVSALLATVFEDDDPPPVADPAPVIDDSVRGLDGAHSRLLHRLGQRSTWTRDDYERLANLIGVLPDGAIDSLNEVAFDVCDAPLVEGSDPMEIDATVYEELCA